MGSMPIKAARRIGQTGPVPGGECGVGLGALSLYQPGTVLDVAQADQMAQLVHKDGPDNVGPCGVLKLSRHLYCRWLANPVTDAEGIEACRANALFGAHQDDPDFGYRFLVNVIRAADKLRSAEPKGIRRIPVISAVVGCAPLLKAGAGRKIWTTGSHAVHEGRISRRSMRRRGAVPSSS